MPTRTDENISAAVPEDRHHRGTWSRLGRAVLWFGLGLVVLVAFGCAYQRIASASDEGSFVPRGQLFTVDNRQMHLVCEGEGSPVVILEAGGAAEALWWERIQQHVSAHTRVCAYDRAGHGWSEPASGPRDPQAIVDDLHTLLREAGIAPPYIMAGHSFGAVWARIFAAQFPDEVVGLALIDSTVLVPETFTDQSEFDGWKSSNDAIKALERVAYEIGAIRATAAGEFERAGYPSDIVPELAALRSRTSVFEADYAEQIEAGWTLRDASASAEHLGMLPVVVLWASETHTMMATVPVLQGPYAELSAFSSNSITRVVEGANHGSILGMEPYAGKVSDAILELMVAARTGEPLVE